MKLFSLAHCPYCKKRINILRIWSLRKKGEYLCPRCEGISNVRHSPFMNISAILAVVISALIYFCQKYVFNSVSFMTPVMVLLPFLIFYGLSIFLVYLDKAVIKRVKKDKNGRFFDETGKEYEIRMGKLFPLK